MAAMEPQEPQAPGEKGDKGDDGDAGSVDMYVGGTVQILASEASIKMTCRNYLRLE